MSSEEQAVCPSPCLELRASGTAEAAESERARTQSPVPAQTYPQPHEAHGLLAGSHAQEKHIKGEKVNKVSWPAGLVQLGGG